MSQDSIFNFDLPECTDPGPGPGRPPIPFLPEYVKMAYNYSLLGATNEQMAEFFDVSNDTFYTWKRLHADFSEAITRGKVEADGHIAKSLYKLAKGFKYQERTVGMKGNDAYHQTVEKFVTPDFRAIRFWLGNRHPELWREINGAGAGKPEGGGVGGKVTHQVDWEAAEGCDPINEDYNGMEQTPTDDPQS